MRAYIFANPIPLGENMKRAIFCVVASAFLGSCVTGITDTTRPFPISLNSVDVVYTPVSITEPDLWRSQEPRFVFSLSSPMNLEKLAAEHHLTLQAWVYQCRPGEGPRPLKDFTEPLMDTWTAPVFARSGTDDDDSKSGPDEYHVYVGVSWWHDTPMHVDGWEKPEDLCVRIVGVSEDGAASAASAMVFVAKDQLETMAPASGLPQYGTAVKLQVTP